MVSGALNIGQAGAGRLGVEDLRTGPGRQLLPRERFSPTPTSGLNGSAMPDSHFRCNSDIPGPLRYPSSVNDKARGVMNWEAFGAVAELLAAVGGLAAVIYLAIQIKLNTRAIRSASIDSWVSAISLGNAAMAPTDGFIEKARESYEELDAQQRTLFHRALAQNFNAMEALFFHHTNGVVDEMFLESKLKSLKSLFQSPGVRRWWSDRGRGIYDPRFVKHVEALINLS